MRCGATTPRPPPYIISTCVNSRVPHGTKFYSKRNFNISSSLCLSKIRENTHHASKRSVGSGMNRNLLLEISLNDVKSSSCVAIDSARLRPEQEAWHHPRWFGTESCRVIICLCSITLGFCKPPPQSPFGDGRWVIDQVFLLLYLRC